MSHSLTRFQAFVLGTVVLLALGLAVTALFLVSASDGSVTLGGWRLWGEEPLHVRAGFHDAQGVTPGTAVRIKGMDAGKVVRVDPPADVGEPVILVLELHGSQRNLVRSDATVQIVSEGMIGGKVVEIKPGSADGAPIEENALLETVPTPGLTDLAKQVTDSVKGVRDGEGALGKEAVETLRQVRSTMETFDQVGAAGKSMPLVRSYVKDPLALLVRPNCDCTRFEYNEADFFEPGRAVLTTGGRQRLDELAPQLKGLLKRDKAELVVLACADSQSADDRALLRAITQGQSESVCQYLKDHHSVQKAGWFTRRKVTALGLGIDPPPDEKAKQYTRIELRVYVPQK